MPKRRNRKTSTQTSPSSDKRSGYEDKVSAFLTRNKIVHGYEEDTLTYKVTRKYIVDFSVGPFFVESKGYFTSADRTKHLLLKEQNPDIEIRFLFQRDNWLTKKKKSRYSDWCKRHCFKYHVHEGGRLPKEWMDEINAYKIKQKVSKKPAKIIKKKNDFR